MPAGAIDLVAEGFGRQYLSAEVWCRLAELEGQRDVARDAERRSVQNRDSLRVVQRELDNLKGERTLGADRLGQVENDARLAEQDLKERLLQKEQLLLEAQRQVEWMEEQSATKFTAMAREKEDLVAELGIRSSSLSGDGRESGGKKVGKSGGGARQQASQRPVIQGCSKLKRVRDLPHCVLRRRRDLRLGAAILLQRREFRDGAAARNKVGSNATV